MSSSHLEAAWERGLTVADCGAGPTLPLMRELTSKWLNYSWKEEEFYLNT